MAILHLGANRVLGSSTAEKTPAYSTTFGATTGWRTNQTHVFIDTGNNMLEFELDDDSTDEYLNYDLGVGNVSNDSWILRYELVFSTLNLSSNDVNNALVVGIMDNATPSGLVSSGDAITYNTQVTDSAIGNVLSCVNGGSQSKADVNNDPFSSSTATGTTFYVEIKRVSATSTEQRVYSTSDYSTTQVGTTLSRSTSSVVTALRYLTIQVQNGAFGGNGYTGYIKALKFWNDQTTVVQDEKATLIASPTLLQENTIFEETDTYTSYFLQSGIWKDKEWSESARGLIAGGGGNNLHFGNQSLSLIDVIEYVDIATTANSTDFGNLTRGTDVMGGAASATRGIFAGGDADSNVIEYVTIATPGNGTDFGDLTVGREWIAGCSDRDSADNQATRAIWGGSQTGSQTNNNVIDYTTIATTGNATDFGDFNEERRRVGAAGNSTRAVFAGGQYHSDSSSSQTNIMDYITIATTGNASDFGNTDYKSYMAGCCNETRAVYFGGFRNNGGTLRMDYITMATTGDSTDFGDTASDQFAGAAFSHSTRGVFAGGHRDTGDNIEYVTIMTTGDATNFGDLAVTHNSCSGLAA